MKNIKDKSNHIINYIKKIFSGLYRLNSYNYLNHFSLKKCNNEFTLNTKFTKKMKKYIKILFFIIIFGIFSNSYIGSAEKIKTKKDIKLHNLPVKNISKNTKNNQKKLISLPLPFIEVASKSVNSERNPFSDLKKNKEEIGISPSKNFTLKGIVQTGNQISAMLKSSEGLSLLNEGDFINKDFKIKQISLNDESVIFTDGENDFKLDFVEK